MPTRDRTNGADVVVVYKKSKLDLYVGEKKNARYAALLEHKDPTVRAFQASHDAHQRGFEAVLRHLDSTGLRYRTMYRANFRTEGKYVVTVGGDGTLLDASRRVDKAWVLGVNSDPAHSGGFLCAADAETFPRLFDRMLEDKQRPLRLTRIGGDVDGTPLRRPVLNDILVAQNNAGDTTRYHMCVGRRREPQKSSGVWISTAAGSTGGIRSAGGPIQKLDDERIQFWVRELYAVGDGPFTQRGFIGRRQSLKIVSQMREGRLFLDGPHSRVPFEVGSTLTVHARVPPLWLMVTPEMRKRRRRRTVAHKVPSR